MEECSHDLNFLIREMQIGFFMGEGLFFPTAKS